jgi:hypothetical protein
MRICGISAATKRESRGGRTDNAENGDPAQIDGYISRQREPEVLHRHRPFETPLHAA